MVRDNKVAAVAAVRLFSTLNRRELGLIAKSSEVVELGSGAEVVGEGAAGSELYVLLAGEAEVRRSRRRVATLGPGSYFGELALFDDAPRSATVTASTPVRLLVIGRKELVAVIGSVPALAGKLLVAMAGRLREADARAFSN